MLVETVASPPFPLTTHAPPHLSLSLIHNKKNPSFSPALLPMPLAPLPPLVAARAPSPAPSPVAPPAAPPSAPAAPAAPTAPAAPVALPHDDADEEILRENPSRYCLFPIKHKDIFNEYKKSLACFWTSDEVDLSVDLIDWRTKLDENERFFIKNVLAFFAASDGIVIENLVSSFCETVQAPEARAFYAIQGAIETIHSETYSLMIDTLCEDAEKPGLFNAIETMPAVKEKADWAVEWIDPKRPFAERLVAFAVVEGIFFSGAFCSIFWMKKRGLMPGLCFANEFISRDEGMHTNFACLLYRDHIRHKPTRDRVLEIVLPAVAIEKEFVTSSLPVSLLGMNAEQMRQYIEFVADHLLVSLGLAKHFHATNPFPFMNMISCESKTNFFEKRVSEYQKSGVLSTVEENRFSTDDAF